MKKSAQQNSKALADKKSSRGFLTRLHDFFIRNKRANMSVLFAFTMPATIGSASVTIDYANVSYAKSKLQAAMMTAIQAGIQAAARDVTKTNADTALIAQQLGAQSAINVFNSALGTNNSIVLKNISPVVWLDGSIVRATIYYTAIVSTPWWGMYGIKSVTLSNSFNTQATISSYSNDTFIINEPFSPPVPLAGASSAQTYVSNFDGWQTANPNGVSLISCLPNACAIAPPPVQNVGDGNGSDSNVGTYVELGSKCDTCGVGGLSKQIYLAAGSYELRYFYASRFDTPNYDPAFICASSDGELPYFNEALSKSSTGAPNPPQGNRAEVYLDAAPSTSTALPIDSTTSTANAMTPTHNNLIDACVYSGGAGKWIQRSINITITTPGNYWITFQGSYTAYQAYLKLAGHASAYAGPLIGDIQLCPNTCPGTVQENYPWKVNQTLFTENFVQNTSPCFSPNVCLGSSFIFWLLPKPAIIKGWTKNSNNQYTEPNNYWHVSPSNEISIVRTWGNAPEWGSSTPGGATSFASLSSGTDNWNAEYLRTMSQRLLLNPGYYEIAYSYSPPAPERSDDAQLKTFYNNATPTSYCAQDGSNTSQKMINYVYNNFSKNSSGQTPNLSTYGHTDTAGKSYAYYQSISVMVDADLSVAHPTMINKQQFQTFSNPDGTSYDFDSVYSPINGYLFYYGNRTDAKSSQTMAQAYASKLPYLPQLTSTVDSCFYADAPTQRKVPIKITKAGYYWLTFASGDGTPSSFYSNTGAEVSDIAFQALGGLSTQLSGGQIQGTDGVYRTPVNVKPAKPLESNAVETVATSSSSPTGYILKFAGNSLGYTVVAQ